MKTSDLQLTEALAKKLFYGRRDWHSFIGQTVQVELHSPKFLERLNLERGRYAKAVYLDGRRIGGGIDLSEGD